MILFISIIFCYGMTLLLVQSSIFSVPRNYIKERSTFLNKLLSCMFCSGVWVGFFYSFNFNPFPPQQFHVDHLFSTVFFGTTTWLIYLIENKLDA